MPVTTQQTNFTAGEFSPRMRGRGDVAKYYNGAWLLENWLIFPHGGITRRPGTEYVAAAASDATKSRLQAFQFNTEQVYALEFANTCLRFFKNGGQIWAPATTAVATSTTALTQTINHTSGGVLHVLRFQMTAAGTVKVGTTSGGVELLAAVDLKPGWHTVEFTPAVGNTTFYLTFTGTLAGIEFLSDEPIGLPAAYASTDLFELYHTQSADTLFIAHEDYSLETLTRRGHQSWSLTPVIYGPSISSPTGLAAALVGSGSGKTYSYVVTTVIDGVESEPSSVASATGPTTLDNTNYINLTWTAVAEADRYNVYKAWNGVYYYIGEAYNLTSPTLADNGVTPDKSSTPPQRYEPFAGDGDNPSVATFFEQRLVLGRTINSPQTVWMSKTADFYNFDKSIPTKDDDRCVFTLDADEVNAIRWVLAGKALYIGTAQAEYYMSSTSGSDPITPSNVLSRRSTQYGSANIKPCQIGEVVIFATRGANKLRELVYQWTTDSLVANDVTIYAEHLFREHPVVQMALAQNPDPHLYCVRDDGVLCVLAYMKEQDVVGWSRFVTDGEFESVCVLHGDTYDEVWVSVKRTIGGVTKRFIERFDPQFLSEDSADAFFLDCGATYSGTAEDVISGLDWLEGETVKVLADGALHPDRVVTSGSITLNAPASHVNIGLGYSSPLSPVLPEISSQTGSSQGRVSKISRVTARLYQSLGVKVGPDEDNLTEPILRDSSMPLGLPPPLFTGDVEISFDGAYERTQNVLLVVDDPLPATILGLYYECSLYER